MTLNEVASFLFNCYGIKCGSKVDLMSHQQLLHITPVSYFGSTFDKTFIQCIFTLFSCLCSTDLFKLNEWSENSKRNKCWKRRQLTCTRWWCRRRSSPPAARRSCPGPRRPPAPAPSGWSSAAPLGPWLQEEKGVGLGERGEGSGGDRKWVGLLSGGDGC